MGDIPADSTGFQSLESSRAGFSQDEVRAETKPAVSATNTGLPGFGNSSTNAPFYSQFSSLPAAQMRPDSSRAHNQQHVNPSYSSAPGQDIGPSFFNMGMIAGALPDYSSAQHNPQLLQGQRGLSGTSPSAVTYQVQQMPQFSNQSPSNYQGQAAYAPGFTQNQYPNYLPAQSTHPNAYQSFNPNSSRSAGPNPLNTPYSSYPQAPSQYLYYPSPYGQNSPYSQPYTTQAQQQPPYNRRASLPSIQVPMIGQSLNPATLSGSFPSTSRSETGGVPDYTGSTGAQGVHRYSADSAASSIPRGPPRKPRQSGHALWVGNLPPGTTVVDLKDHFSKDATKDIESLFLISKSNCAFVNYRTESSCADAMHRFHDSRFHGVRLVCRLRRSSAATSGVPTGPSAMTGPRAPSISPERTTPPLGDLELEVEEAGPEAAPEEIDNGRRIAEKFFIVKSLTLQDLELSVRNGIWATQSHNEETLNKAYETADSVYLIFSANKSGEYFGYARMTSSIHEDANQIINTVARAETIDTTDVPKSIPTPATEYAPKGRIIDDSARGTIFWEADTSDIEGDDAKDPEDHSVPPATDTSVTAQTWGKPFKVEWLSTNRLPFYRTRGLRNPWNANREVKIARDGTELETSVGKRLVQMFHRLGQSSTGPGALSTMPMAMPPTMRPF